MRKILEKARYAAALVLLLSLPAVADAQREATRGWVGIAYTTGIGQTDRNGTLQFGDYPVIESVEPGSPAERAGLQAGDMILAIDAQDLRRNPVPVRGMLEPGRKIVFRFRRDNVARRSTVVVAPRPSGTSERVVFSLIQPAPRTRSGEAASIERRVRASVPLPPAATLAPVAFGFGTPSIGVAGAELTQLNADLRELLEISERGVFVVNVAVGTPASEAGLRSGDVILKAGGAAVQNPGELIRAMRTTRDNALRLDLVRKKKHQTLTLRW